jgi:hypothetical protein
MPKRRAGRPPIYPWDKWTDGQTWRVTFGEDYFVATQHFRNMLHGRAKTLGLLVETSVMTGESAVTFRFWKEWQDGDTDGDAG